PYHQAMTESTNLFEPELTPDRDPLRSLLPGRFLVLDGPDGCGKSTQFRRLVEYCEALSVTVEQVREPGGTQVGEQVREILLDPDNEMMVVRTEMLLYMASRAQLIAERIVPAIERNRLVLADRFISSTLAYQGTAGGLSPEEIAKVGDVTTGGTVPDLVVILDVDTDVAAARISGELDRMERKGRAFHERVRAGYLAQVERDPQRYLLLDAGAPEEVVFDSLLAGLRTRLA
ncbi:MAG: dTMP kinase, partial [Planctomycetota bacterium]|nr:dTMP kinase [Planctomycetota bacterium]